ncbi:MAG TPA: hypothetical protein VGN64_21635 [Dyadobacter sp.]|jgi:hypothetical protein|nr:hypothetical protein [Dyadobacter sp.]
MTREELHALVDAQYDKLTGLQSEKTFYAYEEGFVKVWTELGGQVMQASLKKGTSTDKRKKTSVKPDSAD